MLSFNTKSRYGLTALLMLADHHGKGLLQIKEIAARNHIPVKYLEQIFSRLGQAEIIKSVRGKNGGYTLALDPAKISALQIVEAMEGGIDLAPENGSQPEVVRQFFQAAEKELKKALDKSLSDLLAEQQKLAGNIIFHI